MFENKIKEKSLFKSGWGWVKTLSTVVFILIGAIMLFNKFIWHSVECDKVLHFLHDFTYFFVFVFIVIALIILSCVPYVRSFFINIFSIFTFSGINENLKNLKQSIDNINQSASINSLVTAINAHTDLRRKMCTNEILVKFEESADLRCTMRENSVFISAKVVTKQQSEVGDIQELQVYWGNKNPLTKEMQECLFEMLDLLERISIGCLDGLFDCNMFIQQYASSISMIHSRVGKPYKDKNSFCNDVNPVYPSYLKFFIVFYEKYANSIISLA